MQCAFFRQVDARWKGGNRLCIGLDSDHERIALMRVPKFDGDPDDVQLFNCDIVEATADIALAYKPNIAFYEGGYAVALLETIKYIKRVAPGVPIILDAKRGDIGNTNIGYVREAFEYFKADAVTVSPYLGQEALQPLLDQPDKGIIVLCRTSNKGAGELQDLEIKVPENAFGEIAQSFIVDTDDNLAIPRKMPLYQYLAWRSRVWNRKHKNVGIVVGATYPTELGEVRKIVGDLIPILVPGIGAQGGSVEDMLHHGLNSAGGGIIPNSSSGIIFASDGPDYAEAARRAAQDATASINATMKAMGFMSA